jgi:hypothetical protein
LPLTAVAVRRDLCGMRGKGLGKRERERLGG